MFPRRLHPLQRKLLKVTVFDGNRRDGFAAIPKRSPDICPRIVIFVTAMSSLGRSFYYTREVSLLPADDREKQNTRSRRLKFTAPAVRDVSLYFIWHGTFARQVKLPRDPARKLNELNVLRTGNTRRCSSTQDDRSPAPALLSSLRL